MADVQGEGALEQLWLADEDAIPDLQSVSSAIAEEDLHLSNSSSTRALHVNFAAASPDDPRNEWSAIASRWKME